MRSVNWKLVGLFVIAYPAFLSYFMLTDESRHAPSIVVAADEPRSGEMDKAGSARVANTADATAAGLGNTALDTTAQEQTGPVTPLADTSGPSPDVVKQVSEVSGIVSGATAADERGKAIIKLRNMTKTPESVQALTEVLNSDTAVRNRLFAITALRALARQGDEDGAIRAAVNRARSDEDPKVATAAKNAYAVLAANGSGG